MKKIRKRTTLREDAGKYLLDVSKLVLGSFVISGLLRGNPPQNLLLISGIIAAIVLFILGLILAAREIKTEKPAIKPRPKRRKR